MKKDIQDNIIYVSHGYDADKQYGYEFRMKDFNFITSNPWKDSTGEEDVTFKIRHTPEFIKGRLIRDADGYRIISSEKLQGIAPGQFGVIYDAESRICFGSGEIG